MPNFILRNKELIADNFGEEHLQLLLKSLAEYFNDIIQIQLRFHTKTNCSFIRVDNIEPSATWFEFFVVKLEYNTFLLAYNPEFKENL